LRGIFEKFKANSAPYVFAQKMRNLTKWAEYKGKTGLPGICPQVYPQKWWMEKTLNSPDRHCSPAGRINEA